MSRLSEQARAYILAVLAVGGVLAGVQLAQLSLENGPLLLALCILGALLQALKVEGATARSSYSFSWLVFGAAFALFGAPQAMLVMLVAHLVEWAWHRYPWYIQSLNIATFAVAVTLAAVVQDWLAGLTAALPPGGQELGAVAALLLGLAVFTATNHLLVGIAIKLARGQSLAESGVFTFSSLVIDFGLLCLGVCAALIGAVNPFAILFVIAVAVLLHNVLQVPALERLSTQDAKTSLYNAQYFDEVTTKELERSRKTGRPLSVVMADIDHLRDLNNSYGHLAGDAVIKKVAQILGASARESDTVARFGGEEFCLLMPNTTPDEAAIQVEAMRKAIEAAEFTVAGSPTPIKSTMSFGVAGRSDGPQTAKELIHDADLAVYQAKHRGRNQVCVFRPDGAGDAQPTASEPAPGEQSPRPLSLAQQLEAAQVFNQELMLTLASTIDLRDPYVIEHSRHVARYARLMAQQLGLDPQRVDLIYQAGLVHDIGKLAIPEAILFKPGRLTPAEYAIVKDHVAVGADLLDNFPSLHPIAAIVRYHHERFDGSGYPAGLQGEAIPLESRILALADAVEAMASDRPYSTGAPPEAILAEIAAESGAQFDPVVVAAFEALVDEYGPGLVVNSAHFVEEAGGGGLPVVQPWPTTVNGFEQTD